MSTELPPWGTRLLHELDEADARAIALAAPLTVEQHLLQAERIANCRLSATRVSVP
jgi:hypothetical protein